ncbi:MAG: response regulator [Bacteroidota bacterium]
MNIAVIDDNIQFLETIYIFLTEYHKYTNVSTFTSVQEFMHSPENYSCDIVLMDIEMPEIDGIKGCKKITWQNCRQNIIALTYHHERMLLDELIPAGFKGCVSKTQVFDELEAAMNAVKKGHHYFPDYVRLKNENGS